jgi:hypothetical protein
VPRRKTKSKGAGNVQLYGAHGTDGRYPGAVSSVWQHLHLPSILAVKMKKKAAVGHSDPA